MGDKVSLVFFGGRFMKTTKSTSRKSLFARIWDTLLAHPEITQGLLSLTGNTSYIMTRD